MPFWGTLASTVGGIILGGIATGATEYFAPNIVEGTVEFFRPAKELIAVSREPILRTPLPQSREEACQSENLGKHVYKWTLSEYGTPAEGDKSGVRGSFTDEADAKFTVSGCRFASAYSIAFHGPAEGRGVVLAHNADTYYNGLPIYQGYILAWDCTDRQRPGYIFCPILVGPSANRPYIESEFDKKDSWLDQRCVPFKLAGLADSNQPVQFVAKNEIEWLLFARKLGAPVLTDDLKATIEAAVQSKKATSGSAR